MLYSRMGSDIQLNDSGAKSYTLPSAPESGRTESIAERKFEKLSKALTICITYAANTGGTATLIGNPVNLVVKREADE